MKRVSKWQRGAIARVTELKTAIEQERAVRRVANERADENASSAAEWRKEAEKLARRVETSTDACRRLEEKNRELERTVSRLEGYQLRVRDDDSVRTKMAAGKIE
jgi:chromosome segregation ATPase